jgi:glycosyltransferase involved in cell wall biosynthesis
VDDGSTDDSKTIALNYAEQYQEKVCYLEHEGHQNRGMSTTRNLGIRLAKGEYIAFLDADDVWRGLKKSLDFGFYNFQKFFKKEKQNLQQITGYTVKKPVNRLSI